MLPLPPGTVSTLPFVFPDGVWFPPVTKPPVSGAWLIFPFSVPSLPSSISVVLFWANSPCVVPSGVKLGCCIPSDVLPPVVEFSFG